MSGRKVLKIQPRGIDGMETSRQYIRRVDPLHVQIASKTDKLKKCNLIIYVKIINDKEAINYD